MKIDRKSIGIIIDELSIVNIKIWFKIETIMKDEVVTDEEIVKAARDVQKLNARRSALIMVIDKRLGDGNISLTDKTYG